MALLPRDASSFKLNNKQRKQIKGKDETSPELSNP